MNQMSQNTKIQWRIIGLISKGIQIFLVVAGLTQIFEMLDLKTYTPYKILVIFGYAVLFTIILEFIKRYNQSRVLKKATENLDEIKTRRDELESSIKNKAASGFVREIVYVEFGNNYSSIIIEFKPEFVKDDQTREEFAETILKRHLRTLLVKVEEKED